MRRMTGEGERPIDFRPSRVLEVSQERLREYRNSGRADASASPPSLCEAKQTTLGRPWLP